MQAEGEFQVGVGSLEALAAAGTLAAGDLCRQHSSTKWTVGVDEKVLPVHAPTWSHGRALGPV